MKKLLLFVFFLGLFSFGTAQEWDVYDASVLPTVSDPAFDESCAEPGANTAAIIVSDTEIPGNFLLDYVVPDDATRMAYKIDFPEWTGMDFTCAIRMKGQEGFEGLKYLFDIEIRSGNAGVREKLFVGYDNTIELDYSDVKTDLGFDVHGWHIYRVAMAGSNVSVYVDENPEPVLSGVTGSTTSDLQFKIGDCSGGNNEGAIIDWIIWTTGGAFAPGQGPAIPAALSTATGAVFNPADYKIAFITKDVDPAGNLEELGLISDLRKRGFNVDYTYNNAGSIIVPADFEFSFEALANYDLVILGRGVSSGDFTDPVAWAAVETPIITFSAYLARSNRLKLINSSSATREVADGTTVAADRVTNATITDHPVFTGLDGDGNGEIGYHTWFYDYIAYGADSFDINHNGTLLASWMANGGPGDGTVTMAVWEGGVETYPGSATIPAGPRAFFLMGSDDGSSPKIRNYTAFTPESTLAFHNLIKFLLGAEPDGVEIPISGPVAYYRMEGSGEMIIDAVGSAHGTILNGNGVTREDCGINHSVNFNGATKPEAIIWVDDNASVNFDGSTSFSISLWAKIDPFSNTAEMNLVLKGDNRNDGGHLPEGNGHWYSIATKDNQLRFAIDDDIVKTQLGVNIDNTIFPAGDWNHIVAVRDISQDSLFLYLNGTKVGSIFDGTDADISTPNLPLVIGNYHSGLRKINGNIDELAIWDYALDAATIADMFAAQIPGGDCSVLETISEASDDATLSNLTADVGTLDPAFDPAIPNYALKVPQGTTVVNFTATPNHPAAIVTGDGAFSNIPGTAVINVLAEDGIAMKDYSVNVSIEGAGNARIVVEPGFATLFDALNAANPGDTLVLKNGGSYTPVESYNITKNIIIIAEEIPALPALANMPVIDNLFGVSPLFQMGYGGRLVLIGVDVNGGGAANIINCQGQAGVSTVQSIYINRCRLHNTTDDIMNDARDADADMTRLEECVVKNTFIYDSGIGHALYVKNYHGEGNFLFENITFWNIGQQFNWIRHYPAGITQPFIYNHMTGYNLSTDAGQNKELFGNSDVATEAALDIQLKNCIFHTQVSTNEGSIKFNNTTGRNSITTSHNVLYQLQPIFDLGGTINHVGNMVGVNPQFADPDNGDFTVQNSGLWTAGDDGKIVGATYWLPGFVDDFSDIETNVPMVNPTQVSVTHFPNPATTGCQFSFSLEKKSKVSLFIYDLMGQKVIEALDEELNAGEYLIPVSLKSLETGAYVYRLVSDGAVTTGSLVKIQ